MTDRKQQTRCSKCGEPWDCATFLSETFNHSGGSMVFQCKCGNTKTRVFIPIDVLSIEEIARYILIDQGMDKELVECAVARYSLKQFLKKIGDLKV